MTELFDNELPEPKKAPKKVERVIIKRGKKAKKAVPRTNRILYVRLPLRLHKQLKMAALKKEITMAMYVTKVLKRYLCL